MVVPDLPEAVCTNGGRGNGQGVGFYTTESLDILRQPELSEVAQTYQVIRQWFTLL